MKILGLDYGSKTIGVAIYDDSVDFVYPLNTICRKRDGKIRESLRELDKIIDENDIKIIVLGLPLTMDDREGTRALITKDFKNKLELRYQQKNIRIVFQDERLTTIEASEILNKNNIKKSEQKKYIDSIAAMIILEEYKNVKNKSLEK